MSSAASDFALRNIHLREAEYLNECILLRLGKLNVFCGKNSSGKSTLLEEIGDLAKGTGPHASNLLRDTFYEFIVSKLTKTPDISIPPDDESRAINIIDNEIKAGVNGSLGKRIHHQWARDLSYWIPLKNGADEELIAFNNDFYSHQKKSVIIPPRRNLETVVSINTQQVPEPIGAGLSNLLFRAVNKPSTEDHALYLELQKAFQDVTNGSSFRLVMTQKQNEIALEFGSDGKGWTLANSCGLGFQDLLVILYWALEPTCDLVMIEEPESHLHPEWQRRLLAFLKFSTNKQFLVTTHSNVFVNALHSDRVFLVAHDDKIRVTDQTSRAIILAELGYDVTDNLVSDLAILVEGPSDVSVIETFLSKMNLTSQYNIKYWPLGGDIMDKVDISVLAERYQVIAIVDADPGSAKIRRHFIKKCREHQIKVTHLQRYSIENYFSLRALKAVFGGQMTTVNRIEPDRKLEEQIGLDPKRNNKKIAEEMTLDELAGTDLLNFLHKVEKLLTKPTSTHSTNA
ncbi:MAG: AAA family ATPase [Fimbriimonadaceae bacterium]|nr:AAA family ATPase [Fimbriimonadaceae bacterium]